MTLLNNVPRTTGGLNFQNNYNANLKYGIEEIDLAVRQARVAAGGELLSPDIYNSAIQRLQVMMEGVKDEGMIQTFEKEIANYGILKNSLLKSIGSQSDGDAVNMTDYAKQLEASIKDEQKKIIEGNISDPEQYIISMAEKNYEWAGNIIQEAFDYNRATGKDVSKLNQLAQSINEDGSFYEKLNLMDEAERSRYGIYLKTDNHGGIEDVIIKEKDAKFPTSSDPKNSGWGGDYLKVAGDSKTGFSVNLRQSGTNELGVPTTNWNGNTLTVNETGEEWNLTEGSTIDDNISNNKNSLIFYRQPGEMIKTPDDKAYIFGGFDGKSDKWHYIPNQDITSRMGWWDNYKGRSNISYDTFNELSGIIGEPLTMDSLVGNEEANISEHDTKMADYFRENPGFSPEMFGEALEEIPGFGKLYKGASDFVKRTNIDLSEDKPVPSYKKNDVEPIYIGKGRPSSPPAQKESTGRVHFIDQAKGIFKGLRNK